MITEITLRDLDTAQFIEEKVDLIRSTVGRGIAINALSGVSTRRSSRCSGTAPSASA